MNSEVVKDIVLNELLRVIPTTLPDPGEMAPYGGPPCPENFVVNFIRLERGGPPSAYENLRNLIPKEHMPSANKMTRWLRDWVRAGYFEIYRRTISSFSPFNPEWEKVDDIYQSWETRTAVRTVSIPELVAKLTKP